MTEIEPLTLIDSGPNPRREVMIVEFAHMVRVVLVPQQLLQVIVVYLDATIKELHQIFNRDVAFMVIIETQECFPDLGECSAKFEPYLLVKLQNSLF